MLCSKITVTSPTILPHNQKLNFPLPLLSFFFFSLPYNYCYIYCYIIFFLSFLLTRSGTFFLSFFSQALWTIGIIDMAEEQPIKVEPEAPSSEPPPEAKAKPAEELPKDVTEEKSVIPHPPPEDKPDESKALAVVDKEPEPAVEKRSSEGSINRDAVLARVATEKRLSLIRAWEESEKSKAENKAHKNISSVGAWENSKKASVEAQLKKIEENLEKKKAEYVEKMKNKIALIHKEAEERKAMIEAKRGEELLKAEESAAKYRATGTAPKKLLGCF